MRKYISSIFVTSIFALYILPTSLFAVSFDDSNIKHISYPGWFKDSFLDLSEDIAELKTNDKLGLMILFTTEGCSYCDAFIERSLNDPDLARQVQENFDSIGLEIFDDSEMKAPDGTLMPVKTFAKQSGVGFSPTLLFYGADGRMLLRSIGYQSPERFRTILDYLVGGHYKSLTLKQYTSDIASSESKESAKPLKQDSLFAAPPYILDRSRFKASQPLLVFFESTGCEPCQQIHNDVLSAPYIRQLLGRFDVVRLDAADDTTPVIAVDGSRTNPKIWFEKAGLTQLPALLFFDESGHEVLRTDALVLKQRMENSINYVLDRAYEKNWTYQRYARSKSIKRMQSK